MQRIKKLNQDLQEQNEKIHIKYNRDVEQLKQQLREQQKIIQNKEKNIQVLMQPAPKEEKVSAWNRMVQEYQWQKRENDNPNQFRTEHQERLAKNANKWLNK